MFIYKLSNNYLYTMVIVGLYIVYLIDILWNIGHHLLIITLFIMICTTYNMQTWVQFYSHLTNNCSAPMYVVYLVLVLILTQNHVFIKLHIPVIRHNNIYCILFIPTLNIHVLRGKLFEIVQEKKLRFIRF